jgi:hypothetical protein
MKREMLPRVVHKRSRSYGYRGRQLREVPAGNRSPTRYPSQPLPDQEYSHQPPFGNYATRIEGLPGSRRRALGNIASSLDWIGQRRRVKTTQYRSDKVDVSQLPWTSPHLPVKGGIAACVADVDGIEATAKWPSPEKIPGAALFALTRGC